MNTQQKTNQLDTVLLCLVTMAKVFGIPAEESQLRRAYVVTEGGMDDMTMMRAARDLGLKTRKVQINAEELFKMPLPAVAVLKNGNHIALIRAEEGKYLIVDPYRPQPFFLPQSNFFNAWNGDLILFTRRDSIKKTEGKFGLSWFAPLVWQYRRVWLQVLLLSFLLQFFGLVSPLFTQVIIDQVLVHRSLSTLDVLVLGMVGVAVFQVVITAMRGYLFTHTTNNIDIVLSTKLFRHITALPIKYFEKWQVGDVVSRVRELENIRQFITGTALTVILDTVFAVIYLLVMFMYSTVLSTITLLILPLYIILSLVLSPVYRKYLKDKFDANTENQAFLIETVTGIQTVKAFAAEQQVLGKWEQLLARYIKTSFASVNLSNIAGNIGTFIQQFFILLLLWVGSQQVMQGKLSVGELIAFQMLSGQVFAPILRLVNMWQNFQQVTVSIDRLGDILNETAEPAFNPNRTTLPTVQGDIVFDRVSFRYRADTAQVINALSISIKAGTKVGIVGRSGSGKSTLTKLIQRLYVPETGRILIDGVDTAQVEPAWLRRQIGVVLQENYLFNGTIIDNIRAARLDAPEEEVLRIAAICGVDSFVKDFPKGYETVVGERGTALSGGQRQRIAIARALMTNPSILIFDEATSALDYESERVIMDNLESIAKGRTMLMIAHRLSTVIHCDKIIVIDRGRIAEEGTHDELLAKQGLYFGLYSKQMK